ncbi:hypothetical protein O7635_23090 [Asanoa sp. WMMD1127]|uniref:hypothetical protein n=1 Tax=Asanoa sp. WMMD1127 TaxID=3016107 RepID=UPI002415FF16|nr:hypothetical protein [Asanoa sp. WMMD1127]MDG4824746.1 hypothetical protein [Asanoa sp. WMMD1127]
MSDERIEEDLQAYAGHVRRTAVIPPAERIRRQAGLRRRRRATALAFTGVLAAAGVVGIPLALVPASPSVPAGPMASASPTVSAAPSPSATPPPSSTVESDLTQLTAIGIDLGTGVLLDVADDGLDLFLEARDDGSVDFTGTPRSRSTTMELRPAQVTARNRVVIMPPSHIGSCVTDTPGSALTLAPCVPGDESQTWRIVPAGDSGQFELEGRYGIIHVGDRGITADGSGRTGLQTIIADR